MRNAMPGPRLELGRSFLQGILSLAGPKPNRTSDKHLARRSFSASSQTVARRRVVSRISATASATSVSLGAGQ